MCATLTHAFLQCYSDEIERAVTHLFLLPNFCFEMHFLKMTYKYNRWKMPAFVLQALETVLLILETVKLPFCFVGVVAAEAKIIHQGFSPSPKNDRNCVSEYIFFKDKMTVIQEA